MRSQSLVLLSILLLLPLGVIAGSARITFDLDHVIDRVDPRLYGVFMEPIGFNRPDLKFNTLYGPLFAPDAPDADENGWRMGMLEAARDAYLPAESEISTDGSSIHHAFPAHSFTQIVVGVHRP
jgi:alpha-N-arabinofuranosidase